MNVQRLLELVSLLIEDEAAQAINRKLQQLQSLLDTLASSPADSNAQLQVSGKLGELKEALEELEDTYSPAFRERMEAIGALPYFTTAMADRLEASITANAMTPAVANQEAQELIKERTTLITNLNNLMGALEELGFDDDGLETGEAELGFQIPRPIFQNELGAFAQELKELRFIIRAFSELAGNTGEPIELRQLSTTDPLVFVALGVFTIRLLGGAIKWGLDQWKTVEEIRNLRAQTAQLQAGATGAKLLAGFDKMIDDKIKTEVRREATRLVRAARIEAQRRNELKTHVEMALKGILARLEWGMTVEIRLGPPVERAEGEDAPPPSKEELAFDELEELRGQLEFPRITGEPVLSIPPMADNDNPPSDKPDDGVSPS